MAVNVYPETSDSISADNAKALNLAALGGQGMVVYGLTVSDGGGLNAVVAAGSAIVNGAHIQYDGSTEALTASSTNWIWLNDDATITVNTTGTNPGSSLLLRFVTTDGSGVTSIGRWPITDGPRTVYRRKLTDQTVNNSTTLVDASTLSFTVAPGEVWEFVAVCITTIPDYAAGHKLGIEIPSGRITANVIMMNGQNEMGAHYQMYANNQTGTASASQFQTQHSSHGAYSNNPHTIEGVVQIGDTGGTFKVQFAQATAYAGNTIMQDGSFILARKIK